MSTPVVAAPGRETERELAARHGRALWVSVIVDLVSFIPYALIAILSGSMLLLSDVADYFKSFASHAVSLRILRNIREGQLHDFDYGAGKLERVGSLFGALCYIGTLVAVAIYSFLRLLQPEPLDADFTLVGIVVQILVFAVNGSLWIYYKRIADASPSPLIDMEWRHKRDDTLGAVAILIALGLTLVPWALYLDPACGLAYAIFAIGSYVPALRETLHDLLDRTLAEDVQIVIMRQLAGHFDGYEALHGVRSRRAGTRLFIEIALGFDPAKTIGEAEATIESLRAGVEAEIPNAEVSIVIKPLQQPVNGEAESAAASKNIG
jgi:cation diffusion facilitator family transporter